MYIHLHGGHYDGQSMNLTDAQHASGVLRLPGPPERVYLERALPFAEETVASTVSYVRDLGDTSGRRWVLKI